jgi:DNA-binding NarL/FixJ family response regulator
MEDEERTINVVVVDDHAQFRQALRDVVDQAGDLAVVGEAPDGVAAVQAVADLNPEVVLMDVHMPLMSGIEATAAITKAEPTPAVIALTASAAPDDVLDAISAGASGYLLKGASAKDIHGAIRAANDGRSPLSPEVTGALLRRVRERRADDPEPPRKLPTLTVREQQLLRLLALGRDNAQIAEQLYLSPATVKGNLSSLFEKLGVRSRVQAAVLAAHAGLV